MLDAECHPRYWYFPAAFLPNHLQASRPAIVLLRNFSSPFTLRRVRQQDPNRIIVVVVMFDSDLVLSPAVVRKAKQHQQVQANLMSRVQVKLHWPHGHHPYIIPARLGIPGESLPSC